MGRGAVTGFTHCILYLVTWLGPYGSGLPSTTENCEYGLRPRYIGDQSSSPLPCAGLPFWFAKTRKFHSSVLFSCAVTVIL